MHWYGLRIQLLYSGKTCSLPSIFTILSKTYFFANNLLVRENIIPQSGKNFATRLQLLNYTHTHTRAQTSALHTMNVVDQVAFALVVNLNERQLLVKFFIQRAILLLINCNSLFEVFDRVISVGHQIVGTRHFYFLIHKYTQRLWSVYTNHLITIHPLKGRGVNWLHHAIQV